jgi:hypothetical protein
MRSGRTILAALALIVLALALSPLVTLLLMPIWRWLEARSGLEAVGHSGPAGWCYLLVFVLLASGAASALILRRSGSGRTK